VSFGKGLVSDEGRVADDGVISAVTVGHVPCEYVSGDDSRDVSRYAADFGGLGLKQLDGVDMSALESTSNCVDEGAVTGAWLENTAVGVPDSPRREKLSDRGRGVVATA
jgi:hypothetical protein